MEAALEKFRDGQTIMFGDWHGELSAEEIITGLLDKGVKDIRAIAVSGGMPDQGLGRLINEHRVKSLITTHIGLNPVAGQQMFAGELEVEFVLTPTGIGTDVERGKQRLIIDGREYLLELPLHADVALIKAAKADTAGNLQFRLTGRATNSYMAFAADTVIVEVEELVEVGELGPDEIDGPAPVIDMVYVRRGEKKPICPMWKRAMAKAEAKAVEGGKK